jgi:hypothetical protein
VVVQACFSVSKESMRIIMQGLTLQDFSQNWQNMNQDIEYPCCCQLKLNFDGRVVTTS